MLHEVKMKIPNTTMKISNTTFLIAGLLIAIFLAVFVSPFASKAPDGLEKVASEQGFSELAEKDGVTSWEYSPAADYKIPGINNTFFSRGLAGLLGTGILFLMGFLFARIMSRNKHNPKEEAHMKKSRLLVMMLVVSVAVLGVSTIGYCHQPEIKEKGEIDLGGYLNVELNYSDTDSTDPTADGTSSDLYVDELGISVSAGLTKNITADALILYEENEDDSLSVIDEAYLSAVCPKNMFYAYAGKRYLPFADIESAFITDPYTHDLGETRETTVAVGVKVSMIDVEIGTFNGDSESQLAIEDNKLDDSYASLTVTPIEGDALTLTLAAAYISDITDTDADLLGGAGYTDRVGAYCYALTAEAETGSVILEYVVAEDDMVDLGNAKPEAINIEVVGTFIPKTTLALKYESTDEFTELVQAGAVEEITRLGILAGYELNEKATASLEFITAEGDTTDDSVDSLTLQLSYTF
jgi:hypothetical protein